MTLAQQRPPVPARPARPSTAPPPRPRLDSDVVPSWLVETEEPRPTALRVTVAVWLGAVVAGLVGLAAMATDLGALRAGLTAVALQQDPSATEALVRSGVRTTLLLVTAGQAVLTALLLLWLGLLLARRSWARWTVAATGAVALVFALAASSVVTGGREVDRGAFLVEAGLLLVGSVLLWLRGVRNALSAR